MLFSSVLVASCLTTIVNAGFLRILPRADVPSCATDCLNQAATSSGSSCSSSNVTCLCFDPMVSGYLRSCLGGSCPSEDANTANNYFQTQCEAGQSFAPGSGGGSSGGSSAASNSAAPSTSTSVSTSSTGGGGGGGGSSKSSTQAAESNSESSGSSAAETTSTSTSKSASKTSSASSTGSAPTTLAKSSPTSSTTDVTLTSTVASSSSASSATAAAASTSGAAVPNVKLDRGMAGLLGGVVGVAILVI